MNAGHIHLAVRDLKGALEWLERVWNLKPGLQIPEMAIVSLGAFSLILDQRDYDSPATIGFGSDDCDRDYARVVAAGATPISPPENKPYGARAAYLKGPGALTFEIEQMIRA